MAQNDMKVVIYKILAYLYESMKQGKQPNFADLQHDSKLLNIPQLYWNAVLQELVDCGFIKGLSPYKTIIGSGWTDTGIRITLKGVEYLEENNGMQKVKAFLGDSFQSMLGGLIGALAN